MTKETYKWTDNPTVSGVSKCDTDILNDCLMHLKYDKEGGGSGFNLFDMKISDHRLSGEEAIGWALQGSLVTMTYPDAVAKIKEEYKNGTEETYALYEDFAIPAFTSNTTNNITVSDARNNNDAYTLMNGVTYKSIGNFATYWYKIDFNILTRIKSYTIKADSSGSPEYPSAWKLQGSNDGENWTDLDTKTNMVFTLGEEKRFYVNTDQEFSIYKILFTAGNTNGELGKLSFNVVKPKLRYTYRLAQNGHKIADISQRDSIDHIFASTGIADFYILDSVNEQFYLPKSKWFMQLTDDVSKVNQYNEAGLPNITGKSGTLGLAQFGGTPIGTGALKTVSGGSGMGSATNGILNPAIEINASLSNPIYGNSETVQPPSSNKLLYYKVGDTVVNEGLIDIGNVSSELILLNTQKLNADYSNATKPYVKETYQNDTSWYRVWSDGWIEQGGEVYNNAEVANTITFAKPFTNNNYFAVRTPGWNGNYGAVTFAIHSVNIFDATETSMKAYTFPSVGVNKFRWYACGY